MTAYGEEARGDPSALSEFLKRAQPSWKETDVDAVVQKLARAGIFEMTDLVPLLKTEDAKGNINTRLRSVGASVFTAQTLSRLQGLAASFTVSGRLHVSLWNIAGDLVELDLAPNSRALDLKSHVEKLWKVPMACQKAVVATVVLDDSEHLVSHVQVGAATLSVTLLVSLDSVARDLEDGVGPIRKLTALKDLAELPAVGAAQAIRMVSLQLDDENDDVRCAAVRAFGSLAAHGDDEATTALLRCLSMDPYNGTRRSAVEALARVAPRGNRLVIDTLNNCLVDEDAGVRAASASSLARVSEDGDTHIIHALGALLEDGARQVRTCATRELARIAERGGAVRATAMAAAAVRLEHQEPEVRNTALGALLETAKVGDEATLGMVTSCLQDADASVRCTALRGLSSLLGPDDDRLASAAHACLQDQSKDVRVASLVALRERATALKAAVPAGWQPEPQTILAVSLHIEDPDDSVRKMAVEALDAVAEEGNVLAFSQVLKCMHHLDVGVKLRAMDALGSVAPRGDSRVIRALIDMMENPADRLRRKAVETLGRVALPGDSDASAAAYQLCIEDSSAAVRSAAWIMCQQLEAQTKVGGRKEK